jgi:2,3-bisphosphoglycerate-dependent phosphoglycerate mutase
VPPPAQLLLIRHGETQWNEDGRIQGYRDIDLSERGRRQALVLARHLAQQPIAAVIASDLARARDTAQPLAQALGLALRIDSRLRERGFGIFEGTTDEEARTRWPAEYAIWRRREPGHALPGGGESYLAARARVLPCMEEIAREHAGATVAVITHGGVLDIVYRAALGIAWETPRSHLLPNASINRVEAIYPGPALRVIAWAESGHLEGSLA